MTNKTFMPGRVLGAACIAALLAGCAGLSDEQTGMSPDVAASRGYDAYNRGEYQSAAAMFELALEADPTNAYALQGLAASRDSITYFGNSRPANRNVENDEAIYRASLDGYTSYRNGDLAGAQRYFEAVLAMDPGNGYAAKGLNVVRRSAGRAVALSDGAGTAPVVAATPVSYSDTRIVAASEPAYAPADGDLTGDYRSVGSYDDYVASAGGGTATVEQAYYENGDATVDATYATVEVAGKAVYAPAVVQEYGQGFDGASAVGSPSAYDAGSGDGGLIYLGD